jgi:phytoene dehydrogenase-like protein
VSTDADVVVIGAGLAGLSAAWELHRAGLTAVVLEAADHPGGRIRTDIVDGFRLDRGFQLLNPSYPRIKRLARQGALDLDALQLRSFDAGVRVALDDTAVVLADPRRSPGDLVASMRAPIGSIAEKIAFAAWALRAGTIPSRRIIHAPDRPYGQTLSRWHLDGPLRRGVIEPFLAGVLGEDETATSTRFAELSIRSFVRGTPAVPAAGMQALPDQLAAALPPDTIRYNTRAQQLTGAGVHTETGTFKARAVIVATGARAAVELTAIRMPPMRALSTFWFAAADAPLRRPILSLDGLRRGPIVNAAVMSQAAPTYTSDRRALIGTTIVGLPTTASEREVREQARLIYPTGTDGWELVRVDAITDALPAMTAPLAVSKPVRLSNGVFLAGDHRGTASQQGALASGARAAVELIADLRA